MTITEFLESRIAEDEALAQAATPGPWTWWNLEGLDQGWSDNGPNLESTQGEWRSCPYYCNWKEPSTQHRGVNGQPGHEHLVTEQVIGSWGHDANGISVALVDATHIAVHDPLRVLAECAAKRAIVAEHGQDWAGPICLRCRDLGGYVDFPCPTVQALAAIYKAHPDFRQEWSVA